MTKGEFLSLRAGDVISNGMMAYQVTLAEGPWRYVKDQNFNTEHACHPDFGVEHLAIVSRAAPAEQIDAVIRGGMITPDKMAAVPEAEDHALTIAKLRTEIVKLRQGNDSDALAASVRMKDIEIEKMHNKAIERATKIDDLSARVDELHEENRDLRVKLSLALGTVQVMQMVNPPDASAGLLTVNDGVTSKWGRT
jgi:hypothetical protein